MKILLAFPQGNVPIDLAEVPAPGDAMRWGDVLWKVVDRTWMEPADDAAAVLLLQPTPGIANDPDDAAVRSVAAAYLRARAIQLAGDQELPFPWAAGLTGDEYAAILRAEAGMLDDVGENPEP